MGAAIMLVAALAVGALIGGPLATVIRYPFAPACAEGAPEGGCVATLQADVVGTFDDHGGSYTEGGNVDRNVFLRAPGVGDFSTWMSSRDADGIGVGGDHGGQVTVTMFRGDVVTMTLDSTTYSLFGFMPRIAALILLGLVVLAGIGIGFGPLRRFQGAVATGLIGALAAFLVMVPLANVLPPVWVLPVLVAAYAVAAWIAAAFAAGREQPTTSNRWHSQKQSANSEGESPGGR